MAKPRNLANSVNSESIPGSRLENDAITASKMAPNSVDSSELANDSISTNKIQSGAVTNAKLAFDGGSLSGFRNRIINGRFDIWQRGTTFASGSGVYTADQWAGNNTTGAVSRQTFTVGQTDVAGNPKYFLRFVSAASGDGVRQRIEGVQTLSGMTVMVSFSAKVSSGTATLEPRFAQSFGTGGSPSSNVSTSGTPVTCTTTWQRFTQTFSLPSITGKTLGTNDDDFLQLSLVTAGTGTFDVANVQIEEGSVATPFERRPLATELMLCQRYYEQGVAGQSINNAAASATVSHTVYFRVTKRATPVCTVTTGTSQVANANALTTYQASIAAGAWYNPGTYTASAEL